MKIASALHYSLRWLYKSTAIFLVVFAVLLSCLRLFLPHAHNYRDDLQNYINNTYQTNIIIGSLNTGWASTGPTLLAKNISLLNANGVAIFVGNFEVELDFWQTLLRQQLVTTNFNIENAKVAITPSQFDKGEDSKKKNIVIARLSELFLKQIPQFTVKRSQIQIQFTDGKKSFSISELAWLNKGDSHRAKGEVIVDGLSTNKLKLLVDLKGDDESELTGQAYFEANSINITPWLDNFLVLKNEHTNSSINFQTWLNIESGQAKQLLLKLGENQLTWQEKIPLENGNYLETAQQELLLTGGQVVVNVSEGFKQFDYYSSLISWQVNDLPLQQTEFHGVITDQFINGYLANVDIKSVVDLTPLFINKPSAEDPLSDINPQGQFTNIQFSYQDTVKIHADFSDISTNNYGAIPGVENLSGSVAYHKNILLTLDAPAGKLDFGEHFNRPIPYNHLTAEVLLSFDNGVLATVKDINLSSDELTFDGNVVISVPDDKPAAMALLAYVEDGKAEFAEHYYPHKLMGQDLVNYLERAITDGKMHSTEIVFDGLFQDFPFTEKPGIFYVDANIADSYFVFDADWPAIEQLNANLNFTNNSMLITAHSGSLTGLEVSGVKVAIDDLSDEQVLTVDALIEQQKPAHVAKLMSASSLATSVGEVLSTAVFSKPISGEFSLNLPLNDASKAVAKGAIQFSNNELHLQSPDMLFSNLYGELTFNNDKVSVNNIQANWRGMPMSFAVEGNSEAELYKTNIKLAGIWDKELWQIELPESIQKYVDGKLSWLGDLSLYFPKSGGMSYQLALNADLDENTLNFPSPYLKSASQKSMLSATVKGDEAQSTLEANLNDNLSFYGELSHQDAFFTRAHLVLGQEKMMLPVDGFHISVMLDDADVAQWQPFVGDILSAIPESKASEDSSRPLLSKPERIRGTARSVNVYDELFHEVSFNMFDKEHWWLLEINAKELRSQIKLYPNLKEQGLDINIDFLNLADKKPTEAFKELTVDAEDVEDLESVNVDEIELPAKVINHDENQAFFANIPPMKVSCDSCKFGQLDFGKLSFEIEKESDKSLLLNNFVAKRNGLEANISGHWLMETDYSSTELSGDVKIKKIETEMDRLGFDSIIKDSGAKMDFEVNWPGSLSDFSAKDLNGKIHSKIDDGYLADVSDQARVFSILSLQSIVRKFSLDFRDVFSDGMFYQTIEGDATIEKGIIYTDNLEMDGAAGFLLVKGNTNLASGVLDYRMKYKPNLTSSLPALAWIATLNPVAIIAGVAIDEVITSNVVSEYTFELTGTVEESNLKEVNRKNKNISVGRSSPPVEVEDKPVPDNASGSDVTPLKQYAPIYENNDG